ncbi:MAG: cytochrome c maturation protein CcmE [Myxococcales bacterium]|nr:cytochrome c maturation protein CcmE [Myxococcales bacterium]
MSSTIATGGAHVERKKRSFAPLIITAVIAAIGFAVIGSSTSGGAGMYNYSVADLSDRKGELAGKDVKVAGRIAKGSVRGEPASDSFRFDLEDDEGHKVAIAYKRLLPDPFEEGREAIVTGQFDGSVLRATNLTVKCPSRYADTEDMQNMSEAEKKRYYKEEYSKHTAAQKGASKPATKPAKPATK